MNELMLCIHLMFFCCAFSIPISFAYALEQQIDTAAYLNFLGRLRKKHCFVLFKLLGNIVTIGFATVGFVTHSIIELQQHYEVNRVTKCYQPLQIINLILRYFNLIIKDHTNTALPVPSPYPFLPCFKA